MRTVRKSLKSFARLALFLALIAPVWLGPAMMPLVAALGGAPEHHCACGMKRGQCGCPECEALERARAHEKREASFPSVRSTCDDDDASPSAPAIPACVAASATGVVVSASSASTQVPHVVQVPIVRNAEEPPTPPPRTADA